MIVDNMSGDWGSAGKAALRSGCGDQPRRAEAAAAAVLDKIPRRGRTGTPADVAGIAAFLASPPVDHITGQVIHVNGGWYYGA